MSDKEAVEVLIAHRIRFMDDFGWDKTTLEALDIAIASLATESKLVVKGEWKCETKSVRMGYNDYEDWNRWFCSACGYTRNEGWKHTYEGKRPNACFCENCGANMKGRSEE